MTECHGRPRRNRARAASAALAFALFLGIGAGTTGARADEAIARQKLMMLESYLSSNKVIAAADSGNKRAKGFVEEARAQLEVAKVALSDGDLTVADEALDSGLRDVTAAVKLVSVAPDTDLVESRAKAAYAVRRRQIDAYLFTIAKGTDLAKMPDLNKSLADIDTLLTQAAQEAGDGSHIAANTTLSKAYTGVVRLVSELNAGRTVVFTLTFDTPAEEFEYEKERNRSYEMLVQMAVAEKGDTVPGLAQMAKRFIGESHALRAKSESEARQGDHETAIQTMEDATRRLTRALQSAGIPVTD